MEEFRIIECCEILDNLRIPLNKEQRSKIKGNIPYYGANGIQDHINDYIFDEDLILIAEDGGYFDEYSTRPIAYRINGKSWVNNHAHVLKAKAGFSQEYIFYSLVHKNILPFIKGGTRAKLNKSELIEIKIRIPKSKPIQSKIAKILSTIDKAIDQTDALINKYQRIKTGLMQDLLSKGIDDHGNIRSEETHEFKDSPLGRIPIEWEVMNFGQIYSAFRTGMTPSRRNPKYFEGDILWVTSGELKYRTVYDTIEKITPQAVKDTNLKIYPPGTFFIAITGLEAEGTRGSCAIIGKEATTNQSCMAFEENKLISNQYLYQYYRYWGDTISIRYAQGTKQQSLNGDIVSFIKIHVAPKPEQVQIANILLKYDDTIEQEFKYFNKLISIKSGLMQDLLTGKVPVNHLIKEYPNEEN